MEYKYIVRHHQINMGNGIK